MTDGADDTATNPPSPFPARRWIPPAPVITGCLLGCMLPVIAYAKALSALFGFGTMARKWAGPLIAIPSAAWLAAAWWTKDIMGVPQLERIGFALVALGAQLIIAVLVSAALRALGAGRNAKL